MERRIVLGLALAFVGLIAFLTLSMLADDPSPGRAAIGVVVLAVLALGVFGVLGSPPDDE